jgi:8-oxo-dGTP pyrophosphatase MutT (NUDIX family)
MPDMYVFPGGALQLEDFQASVASGLNPRFSARMGVRGNREKATALAKTAIRETLEETGLLLGSPGDVGELTENGWRAIRDTGLRPCLHSLTYLGRAVTPAFMPIRFNARFFVAAESGLHGEQADSDELSDLQWIRPHQWQSFPLVDITVYILKHFDTILQRSKRQQSFVFRYSNNRPVISWQGKK